jgi:hypothetical protein
MNAPTNFVWIIYRALQSDNVGKISAFEITFSK